MGQKVNPHGARVGVIRDYDTCWYSGATINEPWMEAYLIYWVMLYYVKFLHLKEKMTASMRQLLKKPYINYFFLCGAF